MVQSDVMLYFLIGHFCSEFMFQTEHMITTKWKKDLEGYLSCIEHTTMYTVVTAFFLIAFTDMVLDPYLLLVLFIPHFFIDKYMLSVIYLVFVKKLLAPLSVKLAQDIAKNDEINTPEQSFEYITRWQNNLNLDEDTFLGSIFYVIEFYAVDHIMHIIPTFFLLKYYYGF